jgi:hypothetical protein
MAFNYKDAVPWGRNLHEYRQMFSLSDADLGRKILGCADGPASFNAEMLKMGYRITSCDPFYQCSLAEIQERIDATYEMVIGQTRQNQDKFIWERIKSPDELGQIRMAAMKNFMADYEQGKQEGRYITAELPNLPFEDKSFDLALCSHFLFLYSDNFSLDFHEESILTLLRVAQEVRIFPVLNYNAEVSPHLAPMLETLAALGYKASVEKVDYEFQRGGNQMLRITT